MPRLPPVPISPQTRSRARFCPGVIDSVTTFFQSHSSSSATSWASPVRVPCPISERAMRMTQVSSGLTTTHALISAPAAGTLCASAEPGPAGRRIPMARPPLAAAAVTMKLRRENLVSFMSRLLSACRYVHRRPDPRVGAAATDIGHRVVDVLVARLRLALEERRCGHDLPGLAVTALRHVERRPGLLDGVGAVRRQAFDGDDPIRGLHAADGKDAGAHDLIVDVHRAGPALRDSAAVLGARQADLLADHPEQRRVGLHLHVANLAVDVELWHERPPGCVS